MRSIAQSMGTAALVLGSFAITGTSLVAVTFYSTREIIAENERQALLANLNTLVSPSRYDNDLTKDTTEVTDRELLGSPEPVTFYRAYQGAQPVAVFATPVAPDGYGGSIKLLIGAYADGTLAGVRALSHKETPGLGDAIDFARSDWMLHFAGKSLQNPMPEKWRIKKDGGDFDQFTGATITPRAVVKAVHHFLIYFAKHQKQLFLVCNSATLDGPK